MNQFQLITLEDLKDIRPSLAVSDTTDVDSIILEAQELDLMPLLGIELYYLLRDDPDAYSDFINGVDYSYGTSTIHWAGVKKMLGYYALARIYSVKNYQDTDSGLMKKTNEFSENVSESTIQRIAGSMTSIAEHYQQQMFMYLSENSTNTLFRLWNGRERNTGGSFSIRSAGGNNNRNKIRSAGTYRSDDQYRHE